MKELSQRQRRVAELVRQVVAESLFQGLRTPGLAQQVTISHAVVSKDLRHASIYFTPLVETADIKSLTELLNLEAPAIRQILGRQLSTKYTPKLRFVYDESFAESNRVDALLSRLNITPEPTTDQ